MLNVLVLACGESKRFPEYTVPKQFLEFTTPMGQPGQMCEHVLDSLSFETELFIAIRSDHLKFRHYRYRRFRTIVLEPTKGQADTLYQGLTMIPRMYHPELLVVNCDQGFAPGILDKLVAFGRVSSRPTALTFQAGPEEADRWSYVDGHPSFRTASEKRAVGTHALAGAYYFPNLHTVRTAAFRTLYDFRDTKTEPYISHCYENIPGEKISLEMRREDWYDWGTSEKFKQYLGVP